MERSGTFTPGVIEDIQIKAELARYRIRGFGILRPRTWATLMPNSTWARASVRTSA